MLLNRICYLNYLQSLSIFYLIFEVMKKFGAKPEETVVIGDRCYTDSASGNNAGVDTVCVLSGEVTLEEVSEAQGVEKPTFLLNHVKEIEL